MMKKVTKLTCVLISMLIAAEAAAQEKLIFAIDLIRHGDREPTINIPNSPYRSAQGIGELTPEGMWQEFQNGVRFHKDYIDHYHLLPPHYISSTCYVRSTDYNRTLMSAESVLQGLYPLGTGPYLSNSNKPALPAAFQPIPIHTVPRDQDDLLTPDNDKKHYLALKEKYVFTQEDWKKKNAEFQPEIQQWNAVTGLHLKDIDDAIELGNHLYIRQLHHVPLPKGMSPEEAKKISSLAEWAFVAIFKPQQMGIATVHKLLSTVSHYLEDASQQKTPLKYVLFSSHDSTILAMMSAMQAPLNNWPPYASDLNFMLFENDHQYTVKIKLNGKPVTLPACGGDTCSLQQFEQLAKQAEVALN